MRTLDFAISIDKDGEPFSKKIHCKNQREKDYTDDEIRLITRSTIHVVLVVTNMRPGELASRLPADIDDMLNIDDQPS